MMLSLLPPKDKTGRERMAQMKKIELMADFFKLPMTRRGPGLP
jgi:hypothetical protein